jgi:hypothetical protein
MALIRRYVLNLPGWHKPDGILLMILVILTTGFIRKGFDVLPKKRIGNLFNRGWIVSEILSKTGMQSSGVLPLHKVLWWIHLLIAFVFIAFVPFSKLIHLLTSPANIVINGLTPPAVLSPIEKFDISHNFGVSIITDFTLRQFLDFDACTQ